MITKTLKAGFFIIAIGSFSFVGAQDTLSANKEDTSKKMFKHLDINEDNKITLEEFKKMRIKDPAKAAQVEKRFARMDTNNNGSVDKAEFRAFYEGTSQRRTVKTNAKKG